MLSGFLDYKVLGEVCQSESVSSRKAEILLPRSPNMGSILYMIQRVIRSCCAMLMSFGICHAETIETDICVYGGTAGGVAAAVQAARSGKRAVLLEAGMHLGGMTSGGLGQTDIGNKAAIGGIAREFYQRVGRHYGKEESWVFEPHVAENVLFQMLNESRVPVYLSNAVIRVEKEGVAIRQIHFMGGRVVRARMYIDTSYEGDLMALAGVSYTVGREANSQYHETLNGVRAVTPKHQFLVPVDPYLKSGDPTSGLLPLIEEVSGAQHGEKDDSVQAYNFRLVLTQEEANKRPINLPANYDPKRFELLGRYLEAWVRSGKSISLGQFMHIQMMPGGKTDINNNGGFSTDYIGANFAYPNADYPTRAKIWKDHEDYTRGFLYFLATDQRVPEPVREEMQSWGLTRDEFLDTGGWPHQLYIREARRMVSTYVMTEHNCRGTALAPDSIGLAAYTMDSHNCQRVVRNGHAENEGDVQVGGFPPYPISYASLVPKMSECQNLFVPICLSATHIAYGSIRMEPVFMVLGHSAAVAASIAIDEGKTVQRLDIPKLQERLLKEKQVLQWKK
jgi:hypothetical protein